MSQECFETSPRAKRGDETFDARVPSARRRLLLALWLQTAAHLGAFCSQDVASVWLTHLSVPVDRRTEMLEDNHHHPEHDLM